MSYSAKAFQVLIFPSEVHQLLITDLKHKINKYVGSKYSQKQKKLSDTSNTASQSLHWKAANVFILWIFLKAKTKLGTTSSFLTHPFKIPFR